MDEWILQLVQDGGFAGILIAVLIYFFKFLRTEVSEFRHSLEEYTATVAELVDKTNDILQHNHTLTQRYLETVAALKKIEASLLVAFSGSDVESYQNAAKVLRMNDTKEG